MVRTSHRHRQKVSNGSSATCVATPPQSPKNKSAIDEVAALKVLVASQAAELQANKDLVASQATQLQANDVAIAQKDEVLVAQKEQFALQLRSVATDYEIASIRKDWACRCVVDKLESVIQEKDNKLVAAQEEIKALEAALAMKESNNNTDIQYLVEDQEAAVQELKAAHGEVVEGLEKDNKTLKDNVASQRVIINRNGVRVTNVNAELRKIKLVLAQTQTIAGILLRKHRKTNRALLLRIGTLVGGNNVLMAQQEYILTFVAKNLEQFDACFKDNRRLRVEVDTLYEKEQRIINQAQAMEFYCNNKTIAANTEVNETKAQYSALSSRAQELMDDIQKTREEKAELKRELKLYEDELVERDETIEALKEDIIMLEDGRNQREQMFQSETGEYKRQINELTELNATLHGALEECRGEELDQGQGSDVPLAVPVNGDGAVRDCPAPSLTANNVSPFSFGSQTQSTSFVFNGPGPIFQDHVTAASSATQFCFGSNVPVDSFKKR